MTAIETTATLEDPRHLRLDQPLPNAVGEVLNIIVLVPEQKAPPAGKPVPDFYAALGGYYRDHPEEARRTSAEWMAEMREGEAD